METAKRTAILLILAILVIYIVLGILYESFIHPLTILSGLPSAAFGALLTHVLCEELRGDRDDVGRLMGAVAAGLPIPRGVLIMGVSGCGKSMTANVRIAGELGRSDRPLWPLSARETRVDQYGGLLVWSAIGYRFLSPDVHRPLLVALQAATASSLNSGVSARPSSDAMRAAKSAASSRKTTTIAATRVGHVV